LSDVANDFPEEPIVPFNLACYNCQLGKLSDTRTWLRTTWEVAEKQKTAREWKLRAIDEKDLEPLWEEIRALK
jgi:hypothetical protein